MKRIIISGLLAGAVLLIISVTGLYLITLFFPGIAVQYFDSAFNVEQHRNNLYYAHPFVISLALAWFWSRFKVVLKGSFITRGVEFGLIYSMVATFPIMWLIYAAMNVSLAMVATWFLLALVQSIIAGLIFEKINP